MSIPSSSCFGVGGLGIGVPALGLKVGCLFFVQFRVEDSGYRASGLRCKIEASGFRVDVGFGFRVWGLGLGFGVWGLGIRVLSLRFRV